MEKRALIIHGYDLTNDGGLGANELVCKKAVEFWKSGKYSRIILPAGVNEKTGEGKPLLWEIHRDHLVQHGIPQKATIASSVVASDTATEVAIADIISKEYLCAYFVEAIGFWPHSYKVMRCWKKAGGATRLMRMHHVFGFVGLTYWLKNLVSFSVGLFDPLGKRWPATVIKKRRRDLYTLKHLRHKVIF